MSEKNFNQKLAFPLVFESVTCHWLSSVLEMLALGGVELFSSKGINREVMPDAGPVVASKAPP